MKAFKLLLAVCLVLAAFTVSLDAAYIVKKTQTFTARVNVTGNTNSALIAAVINRISGATETMVTWTNIVVPMPSGTKWRVGNHYVRITYTNFVSPWGISFATRNTNGTIARPKYTGSPETAGVLVASNTPSSGLQLVWQIQQLPTDYAPPKITDPIDMGGGVYRFTNTGWAWKYMNDQASTAFTNRSNNAGTIGTSSVNYYCVPVYDGMRLWGSAAGERGASSSPVHVFLAADFATASIQVFKTTALTLDMYKP